MPDRVARPMAPGVDRDPGAYLCAARRPLPCPAVPQTCAIGGSPAPWNW